MSKKDLEAVDIDKHARQCSLCSHAERDDIELDYIHCIPWPDIERRYGINRASLARHTRALKLNLKRDRKQFYWQFIEQFDFSKIKPEHAIEAAKQLDRLEHKYEESPSGTHIQVVYVHGDKLKGALGSPDRVSASADPGEVPSEPGQIQTL